MHPMPVGAYGEIRLVIVFMPSLLNRFAEAEKEFRAPLTLSQAADIRNKAVGISVSPEIAFKLEERRAFRDLDPDHFWADWQRCRLTRPAPHDNQMALSPLPG
jgi:hypothetical protein